MLRSIFPRRLPAVLHTPHFLARLSSNSSPKTDDDSSSKWRGPVSWATFAVVLGSTTAAVVFYNIQRAKKKAEAASRVDSFGKPAIGGPWSLVDSSGTPVTSGDIKSYHLMYFGFTFCPDICPNELVKIGRAIDMHARKDPQHPVLPVFVTLDPRRDSCAQVGAYVRDFHPRMLGLTGTPGQVAHIAKQFRVFFQEVDREDDSDDYLVDHSIVAYLMSPKGEFLDFYTQLLTAGEVAERMAATIVKHEKLR